LSDGKSVQLMSLANCSNNTITTLTVTPARASRLYASATGWWSPNDTSSSNFYTVATSITLSDSNGNVGDVLGDFNQSAAGSTDDHPEPLDAAGELVTPSGALTNNAITLTGGTTYTLALVARVEGVCAGSPLVSTAELSYILTGAS
jgi:hypothetical protein